MKKVMSHIVAFVLGAALFISGTAVAEESVSEQPDPATSTTVVEAESTVSPEAGEARQDTSSQEVVPEQTEPEPKRSSENPVFCWNVGKTNELDQDCFCVEGSVTNMDEVDCLIESGIVGEDTREIYREQIALNN